MLQRSCRRFFGPVFATAVASLASAAVAAPAPETRLVSCGGATCLFVAGHRSDAGLPVSINGHAVAVEGRRSWHVRLPLAQLRAWSLPAARSIIVAVAGPDGHQNQLAETSLPVGALGQVTKLASLVVTIR